MEWKGGFAYPWLQVSMNEAVLVHEAKALEDLPCDLPRLDLRQRAFEVLLQVAMLKVFHRDEDGVVEFEPAVRTNETMPILVRRQRRTRMQIETKCDEMMGREALHSDERTWPPPPALGYSPNHLPARRTS